MKLNKYFFLCLFFFFSCGPNNYDKPLSNRIANYKMDCTFLPGEKLIQANQVLTWKNTSPDTLSELQFHLYMNAFKNPQSTFWQEAGFYPNELKGHEGYTDIKTIFMGEQNLTANLTFLHPDDENAKDATVCSLRLPTPLPPGKTITLKMDFETKLPPLTERAGFYKQFFIVSQWFPKIGVYENGAWNCHQYHYNSEFFADFGNYDVQIALPDSYVVAATGNLIKKEPGENHQKTFSFQAKDVHDFAWSAGTNLTQSVIPYRDLNIRLYLQPQHRDMAGRFVEAAERAYQYCSMTYGLYPYSQISIVDTPVFNTVMEYPMLFFTGNFSRPDAVFADEKPVPVNNLFPERLTIHEFAHSWWYGMVANNEFEDAWLDEGFAEFTTARVFEAAYGDLLFAGDGLEPVKIREFRKEDFRQQPGVIVHTNAWNHQSYKEYYIATYIKPKLLLYTLNNYFGDDIWNSVIRTYFQNWKFKHPTTADFIATVNTVTGQDWTPFLKQYLETGAHLDYAIKTVQDKKATISNSGALNFPVNILFKFADGSQETKQWTEFDGQEITFDFADKPALVEIRIDPGNIIEFELNKENNVWRN